MRGVKKKDLLSFADDEDAPGLAEGPRNVISETFFHPLSLTRVDRLSPRRPPSRRDDENALGLTESQRNASCKGAERGTGASVESVLAMRVYPHRGYEDAPGLFRDICYLRDVC